MFNLIYYSYKLGIFFSDERAISPLLGNTRRLGRLPVVVVGTGDLTCYILVHLTRPESDADIIFKACPPLNVPNLPLVPLPSARKLPPSLNTAPPTGEEPVFKYRNLGVEVLYTEAVITVTIMAPTVLILSETPHRKQAL